MGRGVSIFAMMRGSLGEAIQKRYHPNMSSPRPRSIGNRIAPARFLIFLAVFAAAGGTIQMVTGQWHYAVMGGFDIAAIAFLMLLLPIVRDGEAASIRRHAAENDANRAMLLVIAAVIGVVLLITIWTELQAPGQPLATLIIATLAMAWLFANTLYALHYAHMFYGKGGGEASLTFPDTKTPDYWDFLYFAFTLGMTFQTSDVGINERIVRRVVLAQCVAAFIFNIGILAFTINTLGS
jgi:uncharacterized membrane protein